MRIYWPKPGALDGNWQKPPLEKGELNFVKCPLLALFGHSNCSDECPLLGVKRK
jgi:hypothetical protein